MGFFGKPSSPKSNAPLPKPSPTKPKTMFEQSSQWSRRDFIRSATKKGISIGGEGLSLYERKKMLEKVLPYQKLGSHISDRDVRKTMYELRKQTVSGSHAQRTKAAKILDYLKKSTGIKI